MLARLSALVIWGFVALTVVFWGLRLGARAPVVPRNAVAVGDPALHGDLIRLFGAPPVEQPVAAVQPEMASRFKLVGVIATKTGSKGHPDRDAADSAVAFGRYGVALIAVDGNPAKAYTVGTKVDDDLVLQSVSARGASIGPARDASGNAGNPGNAALRLELPPLQPAAIGTLPPPLASGSPASPTNFSSGPRRVRASPPQMPMPMQSGQPSEAPPPETFNGAPTE